MYFDLWLQTKFQPCDLTYYSIQHYNINLRSHQELFCPASPHVSTSGYLTEPHYAIALIARYIWNSGRGDSQGTGTRRRPRTNSSWYFCW